ncbi:MAG: Holliday junction resolvase RuvX [Firmicutes bacterium]|nr:Holliday junction resolvase RuvX [Bacillota bacterium]
MRIMALDIGTRRIGVAITDPLGMLAQPLTVIKRSSDAQAVAEILQLLREYQVAELVIGLPRRTDGTEGPEAQAVREFAAIVESRWSGPILWYDERLTTAGAEQVLLEADLSRMRRKQVVDQVAAALILQGYLEYQKHAPGKTTDNKNEE